MKRFKSHFWYTKNQRNGILFLLTIISVFQLVYHFIDFGNSDLIDLNQNKIKLFQSQIDSIKHHQSKKKIVKIYPFNPNYITDYKGYQLGMKMKEIDRLLTYREKKLFVNSAKEFQKITKISDSLLQKIAPYFKFPEWVQNKKRIQSKQLNLNHTIKKHPSEISSTDINKATKNDFLSIEGVGNNLSSRIVKYRSKLQGFSVPDQLFEVWKIRKSVANKILQTFSIQNPPSITKININTASFKEVLSIPYIDYDLCVKLFDYRDEVAELQSISEIKKIKDFPLNKYDRIVLYLLAE